MAACVTRRILLWTLLAASCVMPSTVAAAAADLSPHLPDRPSLERAQQVARAVATVTGAAISPLFGVCVLGAYTYFSTPPADRAFLPFYGAPAFWITLAVLVALVFFKDTVGAAAPLLKKPLDALEILVVNKAALIFAVLPVVWHEAAALSNFYTSVGAPPAIESAVDTSSPHAAIPMVLSLFVGTAAAVAVWLTGHALDILALLSPIPLLDAFYKASRVAVFLLVAVLSVVNLRAAFFVSLLVIGISLLCFWWALRLAVFGAVFAWDILRSHVFRRRRDPSLDGEVLGFTAYSIGGLRKRSFGALRIAADGSLEFAHRPVGIGFRSAIRLQRPETYEVGKGLFFPCILAPERTGANYRFQFRLLPRYTGFEEEIRNVLKLGAVRDLRVPSEFRTAWNWLHGTVARARV